MQIQVSAAYRARQIHCQGLWESDGWTMKVYGIAYDSAAPRKPLVDAAKRAAAAILPQPATTSSRYGLGFLCAHQGRTADIAFVDWWQDEDELHHHMFISDREATRDLRLAAPDELTACCWDLAVIGFERDAWVETILKNASGPDRAAYLATRLDGQV